MVPGNFFLDSPAGCFFIDGTVKFQKKNIFYRQLAVVCPHYISVLAISNLITFSSVLLCSLAATEYLSSLPLKNKEQARIPTSLHHFRKSVQFFHDKYS